MLRGAMLFTVALLWASTTFAQAPPAERPLDDPAAERRAIALHKQLRCLVCQNQSIADSNAELARDLRQLVRERIVAGDTDDQVLEFLVSRYGDWVLLKPPFNVSTLFLWLGPLLLFVMAAAGVILWYRRLGQRQAVLKNLSPDERRQLDALLEADSRKAGQEP